jgi:hypothetical protein
VKGDTAGGGTAFTYHGAGQNDSQILLDGMNFQHQSAGGGPWTRTTHQNQLAFEQTTIGAGVSAEIENAGVQINLVPKEGGNSFSGLFQANGSWPRFQSDNLTPELVERGIPAQGKTAGLYDVGFTVGGRIKRDKVWFFFSDRSWDAKNSVPGSYYNATPAPAFGLFPIYTPDLSRPAVTRTPHRNDSIRITWQVATKHKLNLFAEMLSACTCLRPASSTLAPEAAQDLTNPYGAVHLYQASWSYPATNRLLVEAGLSTFVQGVGGGGGTQRVKGVTPMDFPLRDLNANFRYGAHGDAPFPFGQCCSYTDPRGLGYSVTYDERVSLTWITGSHSFKVGMRFLAAFSTSPGTVANETPYGPIRVDMRGGTGGVRPVPAAIQLIPSPDGPESHEVNNGGSRVLMPALYAQDTWTVRRVTLNLGARFDALNGRWNPLTTAATPWYPSQTLPAVEDSPSWKDLSPRIGAIYDLFGNGKTALKASIGRYVTHATEALNSPGSRLGYGGGTRTWNDVDGDYVPDCDLRNPQANGECDRLANVNFGLARAPSSVFDPDYLEGFGVRPYVWSTTIGLQQELRRGVALNVGYFRTAYGNLTVTDNQAFSPADYTEYCVTAPVNAALGSVGGSRMCGLYDVSPAKFGQVRNLVTLSDDYGAYTNVFNGVDVGVNARFGNGAVLGGGVSTGQTVIDNCDIVKNNPQIEFTLDNVSAPRTDAFCHQVRPFSALTQIKLAGSYPLPWSRLQVSGTFQNLPGPSYGANQTYTSAQIAPSLGRQLGWPHGDRNGAARRAGHPVRAQVQPARSPPHEVPQRVEIPGAGAARCLQHIQRQPGARAEQHVRRRMEAPDVDSGGAPSEVWRPGGLELIRGSRRLPASRLRRFECVVCYREYRATLVAPVACWWRSGLRC